MLRIHLIRDKYTDKVNIGQGNYPLSFDVVKFMLWNRKLGNGQMTYNNTTKTLLFIGAAFFMAMPYANAGFQLTAPVQTSPNQAQAIPPLNSGLLPSLPDVTVQGAGQMPAAPMAPVAQDPMPIQAEPALAPAPVMPQQTQTPVIDWSDSAPTPTSTPVVAPAPRQPMPSAPKTGLSSLAPQTAMPVAMAPQAPVQPAPQTSGGYDMAVGFGEELPLVTALQQVVPADYTYVLGENVPMGQNVSWNGGKPWNEVLDDMVRPLGLKTAINGKRVVIASAAATTTTAPTYAPVPFDEPTAADLPPVMDAPQPVADATPMSIAPRPQTQTAMAPTYAEPNVPQTMTDFDQPMEVAPVPMPAPEVSYGNIPAAPAPVETMPVSATRTVAQFAAPVTPPPSRVVPQVTRGTWTAHKGDSLRNVLEEWATQAGAELFWSSDYDYPLAGDVNASGTFEEATENLLLGFEQARPKPVARLHPNLPNGPAVLVVEARQTME